MMKKLILLGLLALTACGQHVQTAEEAETIRRRDGEQATELFKEMTRFANEQTTVICISGAQYMAWMDLGGTVTVHHYVPLFVQGDTKYARACYGGPQRDLDNVPPKTANRAPVEPATVPK